MLAATQVRLSRPDDGRVQTLLAELDTYLYRQYPPDELGTEINHILDVAALLRPEVTFVAAWQAEEPLGCGAIRRMDDGQGPYAEVKRMYVRPAARGQRIAERILDTLEQLARSEDRKRMLLETGTRQPEALRLYERCGYIVCGPFGGYPPHPLSVFMEKRL